MLSDSNEYDVFYVYSTVLCISYFISSVSCMVCRWTTIWNGIWKYFVCFFIGDLSSIFTIDSITFNFENATE